MNLLIVRGRGYLLIGSLVAIAFAINALQSAISPLALSVILGFLVANFSTWPDFAASATKRSSKTLMRIGVALLGLQISVAALQTIGLKGVIVVFSVVTLTTFGVLALAKLFKMSGDLGLLIGVGFGVCGATAVAAIRPQTRATENETSYAIALISLCGTLSIFLLPFLGHLMGLSDETFGAWAGAAVHDVGQVVATASLWSDTAVQSAIVIKLSRVCLLAPIVLIISIRHRRWLTSQGNSGAVNVAKPPLIPLFVIGFILIAIINNVLTIPASLHDSLVLLSKVLLSAGLVALGASVRWSAIKAIGGRPLAMGLLAWLLVGGLSLAGVQLAGL